jgi:hypothetical protein
MRTGEETLGIKKINYWGGGGPSRVMHKSPFPGRERMRPRPECSSSVLDGSYSNYLQVKLRQPS